METKDAEAQKEPRESQEIKVKVEKEGLVKRLLNYLISLIVLIAVIWAAMTIKNALDNTMTVDSETERITIQGVYGDGFVDWNVRDYWPFFAISIGTSGFEEGQDVNIICPVDLKTDTFQHILTKLYFLYSKDNIKSCALSPA